MLSTRTVCVASMVMLAIACFAVVSAQDYPVDVYDFVVVGAGTSGAAIAGLLAGDAKQYSVLVMDHASDPDEDNPGDADLKTVTFPGLGAPNKYGPHIAPHFSNETLPRVAGFPVGYYHYAAHVAGGAMRVHALAFGRPSRQDIAELEIPEITYDSMLPYMNAFETHTNLDDPENMVPGMRGTSGPIKTTKYKENDFTRSVLEAGNRAIGVNKRTSNGGGDLMAGAFQTERSASGDVYGPPVRSTSWSSYLKPQLNKPNSNIKLELGGTFLGLTYDSKTPYADSIATDARVRVAGVKYLQNGAGVRIAQARNEVILAAGLMETAKLLLVSGIGDADYLKTKKVTPVVHNPQVGKNLVDKYAISPMQANSIKAVTVVANTTRGPFTVDGTWPSWCWNPQILPEFNHLQATSMINLQQNQGAGGTVAYSGIVQFIRARAIGFMSLTDNNPLSRAHWVTNAFRDPLDIEMVLDIFAKFRKIIVEMRRTVPGLEQLTETAPGLAVVPLSDPNDPTSFDRAAALKYIGTNVNLVAQGTGTCRMSMNSTDGVVDSKYKVWGTQNLRVIDTSIQRQPATQPPSGFALSHVHRLYDILSTQYPATNTNKPVTPQPQLGAASAMSAPMSAITMLLAALVMVFVW